MKYYLNIPTKVDKILGNLRAHGYKAYVVGGCVRDVLMGKNPDDWDITTSATPDEVKAALLKKEEQSPKAGTQLDLFAKMADLTGSNVKAVDTGLKHGTVTIVIDGEGFEVTTFRSDGDYSDGRHPDTVDFSRDIKDDLSRRDFTINALCYSPDEGIIDEFGGLNDLKTRTIKAVGDPDKRFTEDRLRVLRAIRFAGTLGFFLDGDTRKAVKRFAGDLGAVSVERINIEFTKLVMGAYSAYAIKKLKGELDEILSFSGARISDWKSVKSLEHAPADLPLRLALILEAEDFDAALKALKFDSKTIKRASAIKKVSEGKVAPEKPVIKLELRKLCESFDTEEAPDVLMDGISVRSLKSILPDRTVEKDFALMQEILEKGECYSRSQLAAGGSELKDAGIEDGKAIGKILDALLDEVIAGETENDRDALVARGEALYKNVFS